MTTIATSRPLVFLSGDWLGLEPVAAAALLDEAAPGLAERVRDQLVTRTTGNPLALLELPAMLTAAQRAGIAALPEPLPLGRSVERIFAERVSQLSPAAQHLLLVGAAEETGDLATVLRVAAAQGSGLDALEEAERAGLISVQNGTVAVPASAGALRGVPARDLCEPARCPPRPRGDPRGTEDVDRRAWHLAAAAVEPDESVAAALEDSADRARRRSGAGAAADALERSAQLTSDRGERGRRLTAAAQDAWLAGQRDRAATLLATAEQLVEDPAQRARVMQLGGLFELRRGMPDKAYRLLVDSAAAFEESDPHTALETLVLAGEAAAFIGTPALSAEVGALAAAIPAGDSPENRLMVALLGGLARALGGDPAGGTAMLREVVVGAQRIDEPAQLLWAGRAALYLGELDAARTLYERGADRARLSGAVGMLATMLDRLAFTDAIAGRPAAAEANAEEGMKLAGELGLDAGVALGSLALVWAMRGDEDGCRAAAERAYSLAEARRMRIVSAAADWALGLMELGLGRPAEALQHLLALTGAGGHPGILLWATPDLVEAAVRAGQADSLRRLCCSGLGRGRPAADCLSRRPHWPDAKDCWPTPMPPWTTSKWRFGTTTPPSGLSSAPATSRRWARHCDGNVDEPMPASTFAMPWMSSRSSAPRRGPNALVLNCAPAAKPRVNATRARSTNSRPRRCASRDSPAEATATPTSPRNCS